MLLQLGQHLAGVVDDGLVLAPHAVQQPPRQGQLAGEQRTVGQVVVAELGTPQVVRLQDRVDRLLRCGDQEPGQVVGGVGHLGLRPAEQPGRLVAHAQHVVGGQVPVHDGRLEPPHRDVLQGPLPALQQDRRHVAGPGRLVHLGQAALAVGLGVVHRQPRVLDRGGGQLVQRRDGPAQRRGQTWSRPQQLQPQRTPLELGVHDGAATLGQVREPRRAWHVERQPAGVHVPGQRLQQRDLRLQGRARGGVLRCPDHPAATLGVDHHRGVDRWALRSGAANVVDVQPGDGDSRQGGEGERRTRHPPTVGVPTARGATSSSVSGASRSRARPTGVVG